MTERRRKTAANPKEFIRKCIAYSFLKMPQIIVQNRTLSLPSEMERSSEWFNLRIPEIHEIHEQTIGWKKDQRHPLYVYIYWTPGPENEKYLLEVWQCSFVAAKQSAVQRTNVQALYTQFVILFRSLLLNAKLLPAYKAFRAQVPTSSAKLIHQISPNKLSAAFPFGTVKPEKAEIGLVETPFGSIDISVQYRRDVSFTLSESRPEVIPAESIIPDYAPSLSNKIPIRTKPMSIHTAHLQRTQSSSGRQRSQTSAPRMGGHSQPNLPGDHQALSFSPPIVGAHSMWGVAKSPTSHGVPSRARQESDPPFPTFTHFTPSSVGAYSSSPRFPTSQSENSHGNLSEMISPRMSSRGEGERILTAVSPPSFSMYERAMEESPETQFDGPVFSIEGSFNEDDVNSFVRFCQSKPVLMLVEEELRAMHEVGASNSSSPLTQIKNL